MRKLLAGILILVALGFTQMMGGMYGPVMMFPYGYYYQPMMPMMMGGMGYTGLMQDPEIMNIIREHQMECKRELMKKLAARPKFIEKMISIMLMYPEAVKETLRENPELKRRMEELLK